MSYAVELVRKNAQATSNWSGGTTTQIAIYPKDSAYSERNFQWRLSSARVESEESVFTSLPGIWRLIMVLEGEMKLEHAGHHSIYLKPFEQDSFSGDWTTTSFGKVRDFNLMLSKGCAGELAAIQLHAQTTIALDIKKADPDRFSNVTSAFYCAQGGANITIENGSSYELQAGDLLLINAQADTKEIGLALTSLSQGQTDIVRADIKY